MSLNNTHPNPNSKTCAHMVSRLVRLSETNYIFICLINIHEACLYLTFQINVNNEKDIVSNETSMLLSAQLLVLSHQLTPFVDIKTMHNRPLDFLGVRHKLK